ncbi:hypothetical protein [Austwickia chelonae]|uniref:hypothetical protein n=1 Tax=Austwickia chelonae TaxID=100225 RepID=UPI0019683982|nr:hypothetical protein [Austwickia chelonae]
MDLPRRNALTLGIVALTVPIASVPSRSAQAAVKERRLPEHAPAHGRRRQCPVAPVAQLTYQDIQEAQSLIDSGYLSDEIIRALDGVEVQYELIGPAPRALPVVAAIAVAAVAWCAKGALSSLPASAIQDLASRANQNIPPPTWVSNAIFGCAGGPVIGALTSQWMRTKFIAAVLAMIIRLSS